MPKSPKIPLRERLELAAYSLFEGTRVGNAIGAVLNRYEAAQPSTPRRSWLPQFVRDARYDANSLTRWELTRKIRYFQANSWLVKTCQEIDEKYTVGPSGLQVAAASSDSEWNKRMDAAYAEWCEQPAVNSTLDMGHQHKLISNECHTDGEVFILKTNLKRIRANSMPKVQLIESHRVSSPGSGFGTGDTDGVIDGVRVIDGGQVTGYYVRDGFNSDEWVFKGVDDVIHVFDPSRIGMYRGISPYHSVLNSLHDLDDLEGMEMQRAKANSENAVVLNTWNGEIPNAMVRQQRFLTQQANPQGTPPIDDELQKRISEYRTILGSKTIALKPGEKMEFPSNPSPSASTQWFWKYKVSQICSAIGIPMLLVLPESVQGTVARAVLDDANINFKAKYRVYAQAAVDMYQYFAEWARLNVKGLQDGPADWRMCHVTPPRAVNVDVGRNSAAQIAELDAGITNWDDIAGAAGTTAEILIRKKARNIRLINKVAIEEGVEPSEISGSLATIAQKLAQAEALDSQAQTEKDSLDNPSITEKDSVEA